MDWQEHIDQLDRDGVEDLSILDMAQQVHKENGARAVIYPPPLPPGATGVRRRLAVVGAPRSATRHMATVLRKAGLLVGHEWMDRDGLVSAFFSVNDYFYPTPHPAFHGSFPGLHRGRRDQFVFDEVWHLTRHPLRTVSSMSDLMPAAFWHWQEKHTGIAGNLEPVGLKAARFWVAWNELIDRQEPDLHLRAEDSERRWPELAERLGCDPKWRGVGVDTGHNKKKDERHQYTWDEVKSLDVATYDEMRRMAARYGYED